MSWFKNVFGSDDPAAKQAREAAKAVAAERTTKWQDALVSGGLPDFVTERLTSAAEGRTPWVSTMSPAELLLARRHGMRPIATVTGTCWYQYGRSWTEGHADGWTAALARIREEALACGANAVVDVHMRTVRADRSASMDFTLMGTAIRVDLLGPSKDPVIATVPALEFVRLLEMGIVPVGLAVGAQFEWLIDYNRSFGGNMFMSNQELSTLSNFWENLRRQAHGSLREDTARQGTGVLAHTQFSQLIKQEVDKQPDRYLGRHIVLGTVVETRHGDAVPHHIETVVDMRDDLSPLGNVGKSPARGVYGSREREGAI